MRLTNALRELGTLAKHENFAYLPPPVQNNLSRLREGGVDALSVDDLPFGLRHVLGAADDRHWMMVFPSGNMWDLRETQKVYDAVNTWVPDQPAAGQYLALSVLYQMVRDDAGRIVVAALIAVFIITSFHMRSWRRATGATAALVAGLCWAGAGLALFRVKVSMVNFVGIPILMGIGIDVVIHLLHRMSEEGPGKVLRALSTTGRAAALSAAVCGGRSFALCGDVMPFLRAAAQKGRTPVAGVNCRHAVARKGTVTESVAKASSPTSAFVAEDFAVPAGLETPRWRLRMLSVDDVDLDYEAVVSSEAHLLARFGPGWPTGLTRRQNLVDLGWHEKEFQRRGSFAYTLVAPDETRVLGCVYIEPTALPGHDAVVRYWVRSSERETGLEAELGSALRDWLAGSWPFRNPRFIS